jgi:hypothetical protein
VSTCSAGQAHLHAHTCENILPAGVCRLEGGLRECVGVDRGVNRCPPWSTRAVIVCCALPRPPPPSSHTCYVCSLFIRDLGENSLKGPIPQSLTSMTVLQELYVGRHAVRRAVPIAVVGRCVWLSAPHRRACFGFVLPHLTMVAAPGSLT